MSLCLTFKKTPNPKPKNLKYKTQVQGQPRLPHHQKNKALSQ